jgi:hypothetical protein
MKHFKGGRKLYKFVNLCYKDWRTTLYEAKAKAVPLHATKALGGRGSTASLILGFGTSWG